MGDGAASAVLRYREALAVEYDRRFPRSRAFLDESGTYLLDHTSHAMRWNDPFMPVVRTALGSAVEDLDGNRFVDYWQGHFANLLGHNPAVIREALALSLEAGCGLQSGMLHEIEHEVAELICTMTDCETVRMTTSGSLGTFYAAVLARAFTGRDRVLKVSGGWHGSQPFGLKGVSAREDSFEHMESEGLSASTESEVVLTRFNDVEDLRRQFARRGDRIACFLLEPLLGAGGGIVSTAEYLQEARRLTDKHGALLVCDEIITAFRFRLGDFSAVHGVRPDIIVMGKVLGGGMPVAAVAGRRDVLSLGARDSGRVKFEGGTYSAHELSLIAVRTMLHHLRGHADEIYLRLGEMGHRMRRALGKAAADAGFPCHVLGAIGNDPVGSSLVFLHPSGENAPPPSDSEGLAEHEHPCISERLLKATLLLEGVSSRSGLGAISTAHTDADLERTIEAYSATFERFRKAGLCSM